MTEKQLAEVPTVSQRCRELLQSPRELLQTPGRWASKRLIFLAVECWPGSCCPMPEDPTAIWGMPDKAISAMFWRTICGATGALKRSLSCNLRQWPSCASR
jgi:hypothetical protein